MNEHENFWQGEFGDRYSTRNQIDPQDRLGFFQEISGIVAPLQSICEIGPNAGHNLKALRTLYPQAAMTGVEINAYAYEKLAELDDVEAIQASIHTYETEQTFDLVMTCGVLIHLDPETLPSVYAKLFKLSRRYILINEYYNPSPMTVTYRGEEERLYKRDFGGELWDQHPGQLACLDYGFLWKRLEPTWDDQTWFLFEKVGA